MKGEKGVILVQLETVLISVPTRTIRAAQLYSRLAKTNEVVEGDG